MTLRRLRFTLSCGLIALGAAGGRLPGGLLLAAEPAGDLSGAFSGLRAVLSSGQHSSPASDAPAVQPKPVWDDKTSTRVLLGAWIELLGEIDPAAARFIGKDGANVGFDRTGSPRFPSPTAVGLYIDGKVYVNLDAVGIAARDVFDRAPAEEAYKVLALMTLPILVHEAHHGITDQRLRERWGLKSAAGTENEFISHYHQSAAAKRIYEKYGELLNKHGFGIEIRGFANYLRNAFGEGLFSLNDRLAAWYPGYPSAGVLDAICGGADPRAWAASPDASEGDKLKAFYAELLGELRRDWARNHDPRRP